MVTTDRESKRSGPWVAIVALLGVIGLPVLYVLSMGPAVWMHEQGYVSPGMESVLDYVYAPIAWAADNWEWAGDILLMYLMWWVDLGR